MAEACLKIAVIGPNKAGKTLISRLLGNQSLTNNFQSSVPLRIQEFKTSLGLETITVQLWDWSGSFQFQSYWSATGKNLDGLLLVTDPSRPDAEKDLEGYYSSLAPSNSLEIRQCFVLAVGVAKEGGRSGSWSGLRGKLAKLPSGYVSVSVDNPSSSQKDALNLLGELFEGCLSKQKHKFEQLVVGE